MPYLLRQENSCKIIYMKSKIWTIFITILISVMIINNQAMLSKAAIKEKEDQHLNNFNLNKTFEYFVMIKFKLRQDVDNQFFKEVENYLRKFPYEGLKFCEIFDLENDIGEYAFIEFFNNAENHLKAIDRRDNPILDKLRKFVIPYDNGDDFAVSHGKLTKSFNHLLI